MSDALLTVILVVEVIGAQVVTMTLLAV